MSAANPAERTSAYVIPFLVFLGILSLSSVLPTTRIRYVLTFTIMAVVIALSSRKVLRFRLANPLLSAGIGVAVFLIWIGPDVLWPEYRSHWLFQNSLTGAIQSTLPPALRTDPVVLILRTLRAVVIIPIAEELFWRAWMMRWIVSPRFQEVALGTYTASSFWITAALFASEHGPFWDVGLLAGVAYNGLMLKTRSLGDCIFSHAITNALLSGYVIWAGKWEYWS